MAVLVICSAAVSFGQTTTAPLQFSTLIPVPNWATSGTYQADFDAMWFNPQNGILYLADRINDGATAIDTKTWTYLGTTVPLGCGIQTIAGSSTSRANCRSGGILVTQDTQKLVWVTPGPTAANPQAPSPGIWVSDLRSPTAAPVLIQTQLGPDFIDYNPINHMVYVKTNAPSGGAGNIVAVIDLRSNTVVSNIDMKGASIEQMHVNPVDGFIYIAITDAGKQSLAKVDPNTNAIVTTYPLNSSGSTCTGHQFEIDPVADVAVMGCSEASLAVDLKSGNVITTYPLQVNSDTTGANLNLRHIYVTSTTGSASSGCPKDQTGAWPAVGVVSTGPSTGASAGPQYVGPACGGRAQKGGAADPINHNVYVMTKQYPVDANSASSGQAGVLVFHDPGAPVTGTPAGTEQASSSATLAAVAGSGVSGSVTITLRRRSMFVDGGLTGASANSGNTDLIITTTVGMEVVHCGVNGSGTGYCQGRLVGDPLIGGVVDVGSGGKLVASGPITLGATIPTFISTDSFFPTE